VPDIAMVFAAGFGKRMLPITNTIPKPLVKVAGKTLLDYTLDNLAKAGVKTAVVNTHHLADVLEKHLKARGDNPHIIISHEPVILETGGGIVNAMPLLGDKPFLSINSDIMLVDGKTSAIKRLATNWNPEKMDALMLLQPVESAVGYDGTGDFDLSADGHIINDTATKPYVFTGVMILKPEIFNGYKAEPFSVYRDCIAKLDKVFGLVHDGKWLHIGTPEGIKLAEAALAS
jgi:MurNAc alpha-1-phosphate uridylyltransferase